MVIDLHSKNEPWDLHFSKALFKGLYSDGPYMYREEFAFPNQIARSKFIVFALFYLVFECKFSKYKLLGGLYLERWFNRGFFALPRWGAYFWNFTASKVISDNLLSKCFQEHFCLLVKLFSDLVITGKVNKQ